MFHPLVEESSLCTFNEKELDTLPEVMKRRPKPEWLHLLFAVGIEDDGGAGSDTLTRWDCVATEGY